MGAEQAEKNLGTPLWFGRAYVAADPVKLRELIDLEVQLLRDEQALHEGDTTIGPRDRAIGHQITAATGLVPDTAPQFLQSDRSLRHRVCQQFVQILPEALRNALPGARVERGYRVIGWLLCIVFFLVGLGAASTAMRSTDTQPINVLAFIVIFMVVQIALLVLYPVFMLLRRIRGTTGGSWLQRGIAQLAQIRALDKWTGGSLSEMPETLQQLRLRQNIYGSVQQWSLFASVQRVAIGFNLAALLASLYMVAFHDLAHSSWSTTLSIDSATLHRWMTWIGTPWSFIAGGVPSAEAIEYSRWIASESSGYPPVPDGIDAAELRRQWWPFLILGLVTWGLLPRLLAFGVGTWMTRRHSSGLALDHMAVQHLFERLFPLGRNWSGPNPDAVRGAAPRAPKGPLPKRKPLDPTAACYVVCWGTLHSDPKAVAAHILNRFGRRVEQTYGAGLADLSVEEQTLKALTRTKAKRIVLAMPEGQQPTKDVIRFLAALRAKLGTECELIVGLLAQKGDGFGDVDVDELDGWRQKLLAAGDPYLTLSSMESP